MYRPRGSLLPLAGTWSPGISALIERMFRADASEPWRGGRFAPRGLARGTTALHSRLARRPFGCCSSRPRGSVITTVDSAIDEERRPGYRLPAGRPMGGTVRLALAASRSRRPPGAERTVSGSLRRTADRYRFGYPDGPRMPQAPRSRRYSGVMTTTDDMPPLLAMCTGAERSSFSRPRRTRGHLPLTCPPNDACGEARGRKIGDLLVCAGLASRAAGITERGERDPPPSSSREPEQFLTPSNRLPRPELPPTTSSTSTSAPYYAHQIPGQPDTPLATLPRVRPALGGLRRPRRASRWSPSSSLSSALLVLGRALASSRRVTPIASSIRTRAPAPAPAPE